jgi:hypothetical protein
MAILRAYGFETEQPTAPPFDTASGNLAISPVHASGRYGLRSDAAVALAQLGILNDSPSPTLTVGQFRFMIPTGFPNGADENIGRLAGVNHNVLWNIVSATPLSTFVVFQGDGTISNSVDSGAVIAKDTWYLINYRNTISGTTRTLEWQLGVGDGAAVPQTTNTLLGAVVGGDIGLYEIGCHDPTAGILAYFDDWVIATEASDYPLNMRIPYPYTVGSYPTAKVRSRRTSW